jgi:hypothetical protein
MDEEFDEEIREEYTPKKRTYKGEYPCRICGELFPNPGQIAAHHRYAHKNKGK